QAKGGDIIQSRTTRHDVNVAAPASGNYPAPGIASTRRPAGHRSFTPSPLARRSMKILVTGGAGFSGSAVIRQLIRHTGHSVVNLDKLTYAGNPDSLAEVGA